jgi:hypothetical protein
VPKAVPAAPEMGKAKGSMPMRGERTATNERMRGVRHPASHAEWENLGK